MSKSFTYNNETGSSSKVQESDLQTLITNVNIFILSNFLFGNNVLLETLHIHNRSTSRQRTFINFYIQTTRPFVSFVETLSRGMFVIYLRGFHPNPLLTKISVTGNTVGFNCALWYCFIYLKINGQSSFLLPNTNNTVLDFRETLRP